MRSPGSRSTALLIALSLYTTHGGSVREVDSIRRAGYCVDYRDRCSHNLFSIEDGLIDLVTEKNNVAFHYEPLRSRIESKGIRIPESSIPMTPGIRDALSLEISMHKLAQNLMDKAQYNIVKERQTND